MTCPTCRGSILEFFEETSRHGARLQVVRCINGHRFEREKPGQAPREETGMTNKKNRIGVCAHCKRQMNLPSRRLCGKCYFAFKRAGTLDSLYPAKGSFPQKKTPPPPVEAEPVIAGDETAGEASSSEITVEASGPVMDAEKFKEELASAVSARPSFAADLSAVLEEIGAALKAKNLAYGDSALNPVRVFSKADPLEQINVRLDDKLSRLMRGDDAGEDTEADLLGYLILKRVAMRRRA